MKKYNKLSIIIPTHKCPDALELCLRSAIEGQVYNNEIIVVVDGFYDLNKDVLEKYKGKIKIINFHMNVGLCKGTNFGVYNATNEIILIVNDDNVFPKEWDKLLLDVFEDNMVLTPNQIEPTFSMFPQFHIKDLGRNPKTFDLNEFWKYENTLSDKKMESSGGTLPFMMTKKNYMILGGWDENYPLGLTADWEFFYKCQLLGLDMNRYYGAHFYHFESLSTRKDSESSKFRDIQQSIATNYFVSKWGGYLYNDNNNIKHLI